MPRTRDRSPLRWSFIFADGMHTDFKANIPARAQPAEFLFALKKAGFIDFRSRFYLTPRDASSFTVVHKASEKLFGYLIPPPLSAQSLSA